MECRWPSPVATRVVANLGAKPVVANPVANLGAGVPESGHVARGQSGQQLEQGNW